MRLIDSIPTSDLRVSLEELEQVNLSPSLRVDLTDVDYLRPAWSLGSDLFVWCDEHLRWNQHGCCTDETRYKVTSREPHHTCNGSMFLCLGEAPPEVAKIVRRYGKSVRAQKLPPPIRRVYVTSNQK